MGLMLQPFRKYAEFEGRARRSEFWLFCLFFWIVVILLECVVALGQQINEPLVENGAAIAVVGFGAVCLLPYLALRVRRLHDTDRSGWWILLGALPFIGALVLLIFYCIDGDDGPNVYGRDPKGRGPLALPALMLGGM